MSNIDTSNRVKAQNKLVFGGKTDQNQIIPIKYTWAWEAYLEANRHHWLPGHVQYGLDLKQGGYEKQITAVTYKILELYLSWRSITSTYCREILPLVYSNTSAPECRQFMLRMLQEESVCISAFSSVPLIDVKNVDLARYRLALAANLMEVSKPHLKSAMEPQDYAALLSIVLQLKGSALVPLEAYLTNVAKLPTELHKLVAYLVTDSERQRVFFANLLANFLEEQPAYREFVQACLSSVVPDSFLLHWSGIRVMPGEKAIQYGQHVWTTVFNQLRFNTNIISSPYLQTKTVHVTTDTKSTLDWN